MMISAQKNDVELQKKVHMIKDGEYTDFSVKEAGSFYFQNKLCVPDDKELKKKLFLEAYNTVFTMYPRGNKMYQDLKQHYWWKEMKRDVIEYLSKCLTCQQVKAEHQVPTGRCSPFQFLNESGITLPWILCRVFPSHNRNMTMSG